MANQNAEVVDLLQAIGDLMELRGDEAFKVRAYREAARQMDRVTEDVATLAAEGRLTEVRGIGPSIAKTIETLLTSIARFRKHRGYVARYVAESMTQTVAYALRQIAVIQDVEVVG